MPELINQEVAPAAVEEAAGKKKTAKKAAKKAPTKKATKKAEKATAASREKKDGLRKPQLRILKALAKSGAPLNRAELAKAAPVDVASCVEYLGSTDDKVREANDKKHFPSLITLGFVKSAHGAPAKGKDGSHSEAAGATVYSITAAGRKEVEKTEKALKAAANTK